MSNIPLTRRVLRRESPGAVRFHDESIPSRGSLDVLVRVRAVSLNYKDVAAVDGKLPSGVPLGVLEGGIVGSEFAGEIMWIGDHVRLFKKGDRVVSLVNLDDITGNETSMRAFGHNIDGTLAQYIVVPENALVKIPQHLTWAEASVIPCAGLTAWSAMEMNSRLTGKTVLIQGTGGVSLVSLLLAVRAGATVVITSSSDEKLLRAKELGATYTINYAKVPHWEQEVLSLTDGLGAHFVIENGGAGTLLKSVIATRNGGQVSQVGFLTNKSEGDLVDLVNTVIIKKCRIVGIRVGIKGGLEELMEFLSATQCQLAPCIDRVFQFEQAVEALDYMRGSTLFGKVVIEF
ncbi:chaperonin 10-like protein [Xylogone sp. PMI_703]|nr:chaperonin 10-like protein [Xylogone sp. PMI_703]